MKAPLKALLNIRLISSLFAVALLLNSHVAVAALKATINKNTFSLTETIQLVLYGDSQTPFHDVDLSALSNDFEVIHRSSEKRVSVTNGQSQETVKLNLLMRAKQHGRLMIPSLQVGNEKTDAIQIQVNQGDVQSDAQSSAQAKEQAVYLDMHWLKQAPAYVQSQMTLKVRIRHDGSLQQGQLDSPNIQNAMVNALGSDTSYQENMDGRTWQVIERHFAITPLKSGELTVPPIRFKGQISRRHNTNSTASGYFEPFFGQTIALQTQGLTREILSPVDTFTGSTWLPAKSLALAVNPLAQTEFNVGDPINLKIDIEAVGLLAEQLPGIQMDALPDNIGVYPDDPVLTNQSSQTDIVGKLSLTIVLIPAAAALVDLPELGITWWNTISNQQETTKIKLPTIKIIDAAGDTIGGDKPLLELESSQNSESSISLQPNDAPLLNSAREQPNPVNAVNQGWKWIAMGALFGWLLTAIFLLRKKPASEPVASAKPNKRAEQQRLFNQIKQHANANDPAATYEALQALDRHVSRHSQHTNESLQSLLTKMGSHQASEQIDKLKQHLFAVNNPAWDANSAWPSLAKGLQKLLRSNDKPSAQPSLKSLYPN